MQSSRKHTRHTHWRLPYRTKRSKIFKLNRRVTKPPFTFTHWPNIPRRPWIITSKHNKTTHATKSGSDLWKYRWTNPQSTLRTSLQICPLFSSCTTQAKNPFLSSLPLLINGKVGEKRGTNACSEKRGAEENTYYVIKAHVIVSRSNWLVESGPFSFPRGNTIIICKHL